MVKGFYKDLLLGIIIVLLLLGVCVSVDYADDAPIKIIKNQSNYNDTSRYISINNKGIVAVNNTTHTIVGKSSDKIHTIKQKYPIVTITAKPSCGCGYGYHWHTRSFISYCPHCHRYGTLANVHKYPARYEQELTCRHCGADYCGVCGKEKYSWSHYYLRKC